MAKNASKKKPSKHRFLFNKMSLIRAATADCVADPRDDAKRAYLRGLADGCHGTADGDIAQAIHVARQVIIVTKER